jgi:hypothetical protein
MRGFVNCDTASGGRGSRGGGYKWMKFHFIHPHPNPLPSREREFFDFLRDHRYSRSKTFSVFNESNRFGYLCKLLSACLRYELAPILAQTEENPPWQVKNLFESLELGIWILFVICYLVLGISYIQLCLDNLDLMYLWDTTLYSVVNSQHFIYSHSQK